MVGLCGNASVPLATDIRKEQAGEAVSERVSGWVKEGGEDGWQARE